MELASPDRKILGVSGFSRREGLGYLNARLTGYRTSGSSRWTWRGRQRAAD